MRLWPDIFRFTSGSKNAANRLIALDADGVLIDYHEGYAMAWERAFGERPRVKDPGGYHPKDYWDVPELDQAGRIHLNERGFTREVWESMPAIAGAREACELLVNAGFELVCITALSERYRKERRQNLKNERIPVRAVHTVGHAGLGNPKAAIIKKLSPAAFVDDYLPYLQGITGPTWKALIKGRPNNSPNTPFGFKPADSTHSSLFQFATFWLERRNAGESINVDETNK